MRALLFRGKRKGDGKWVIGDSILRFRDGGTFIVHGGSIQVSGAVLNALVGSKLFSVMPQTVCRYTGIDDKNGSKIFEGDLIKEEDVVYDGKIQIPGQVYEVTMKKGAWVGVGKHDWGFLHSIARDSQVIGNVCEPTDEG